MTDIIIIGLLLVIIFMMISAIAPEIFIYGSLFLCIIFFIITAVLGINSVINDPVGSLWWAVDHNPVISMATLQIDMLNSMSYPNIPPIDPKEWRVFSIVTYIIGIVAFCCIGYKFLFLFGGRRKCVE